MQNPLLALQGRGAVLGFVDTEEFLPEKGGYKNGNGKAEENLVLAQRPAIWRGEQEENEK